MAMAAHSLDSRAGRFSIAFRLRPTEDEQDEKLGLQRDEASGLLDSESFGKVVEQKLESFKQAGTDVKMTVMSMPQLKELQERLGGDQNESLMHSVGAFLKANSADGDTAARVDDQSFSLIHEAAADIEALEQEIAELTKEADPDGKGVEVETATVDAPADSIGEDEMAKGLIYTLNHFKEATGQGLSLKSLKRISATSRRKVLSGSRIFGRSWLLVPRSGIPTDRQCEERQNYHCEALSDPRQGEACVAVP